MENQIDFLEAEGISDFHHISSLETIIKYPIDLYFLRTCWWNKTRGKVGVPQERAKN